MAHLLLSVAPIGIGIPVGKEVVSPLSLIPHTLQFEGNLPMSTPIPLIG